MLSEDDWKRIAARQRYAEVMNEHPLLIYTAAAATAYLMMSFGFGATATSTVTGLAAAGVARLLAAKVNKRPPDDPVTHD